MHEEKIIVINDYETANKAACEQLRLNGFKNIFSFLSATEALKAIPEINPHLIISDISMPELDGWQLSKILKSEEYLNFNHIPIILISAIHKDAKAQQLALESGASAFLHAPYDIDDLMTLVSSLLISDVKTIESKRAEFQRKIVVADDEPEILKVLRRCLEENGYQVETVEDGEKAIKAIEKINPHIVLLDYRMPEKDGMEVLKWIKETTPEMAVIILTAHGSETMAVSFMKAGADDYIPKPFDFKQVVETCDAAFNKYNIRLINKQFKDNAIKLKASEEKYRAILDNSSDVIYILDNDGIFNFVNREAENILGYKPEEIVGRHFSDFILREDIERVQRQFFERRIGERAGRQFDVQMLRKVKKDGDFEICNIPMEIRAKGLYSLASDKSTVDMVIRAQGLYREESQGKKVFRGTIGIARDITDRKRMEEQIIQTEKLSTIGTLVSGVAHELNNPLTGILGFSELILEDQSQPELIKKDIKKIHNEAMRCSKIVRSLLTFARKSKMEKDRMLINEVVQNTVELLEFQIKSANIQLTTDLDRENPQIYGDFHQVQQILINIINNAIHAIQEANRKGSISIKTRVSNGKSVTLSIKNDGSLIKSEIIGKIFDPFFTTKEGEKGTGLGLSIAYGIIKDHNGSIRAENLPDGVLFSIELPLKSHTPSPSSEPQKEQEKFIAGKRVMVVEDDEVVRNLIERVLEKNGHHPVTASGGEKALEIVKTEQFDLVISDFKMPGMDGIEFYKRLIKFRPELAGRFVLVTGAIGKNVTEFAKKTGNHFLQKPFSQLAFKKLIAEVFRE